MNDKHSSPTPFCKGSYCEKFETNKAVYYQGPTDNLVEYGNSGSRLISTGGFTIPFDESEPVRWWKHGETTYVIDKEGEMIDRTYFDRIMSFPWKQVLGKH